MSQRESQANKNAIEAFELDGASLPEGLDYSANDTDGMLDFASLQGIRSTYLDETEGADFQQALRIDNYDLIEIPDFRPIVSNTHVIEEHLEGGFSPHFSVNKVRFLALDQKTIRNTDIHERFVRFLRNSEVSAIMIADSSPSESLAALAREAVNQGLTVHYRDHHIPHGSPSHDSLRKNAAAIKELCRVSGGTFRWERRDDVPTCTMLIEDGELLTRKIGAYICTPCDIDSFGTYLKGIGLRYDHFPGSGHPMELDIALIDSPQSRKTKAMFAEHKNTIAKFHDSDYQHQMLPGSALYLQAYGGIAMNQAKFKRNLHKLNFAFVNSIVAGHLDGEHGGVIQKMASATVNYDNVLQAIIKQHAKFEWPTITINLAALSPDAKMKELLQGLNPQGDPNEALSLAAAMIGRRSHKVHSGRIKQNIREILSAGSGSVDAIIVAITADQKRPQGQVEGIGVFSRLNFSKLNQIAGSQMFRAVIGTRALFSVEDLPDVKSYLKYEGLNLARGAKRRF